MIVNTVALPSFVLGYHGCDHSVAERVLSGELDLDSSSNDYDWLGKGIYFWEHNPQRALDWACDLKRRGRAIRRPAVVGAVINLGECLNLLDASALALVKNVYEFLAQSSLISGEPLPENRSAGRSDDLLLRKLDCAVINKVMELNPTLTTVRGVFVEGAPLYPNGGFREKTHIQICVRDTSSIIGYFRVRNAAR